MSKKVTENLSKKLTLNDIEHHFSLVLADENLSYCDKCLYQYLFLSVLQKKSSNNYITVKVKTILLGIGLSYGQYQRSRKVLVKYGYIRCYGKDGQLLSSVSGRIQLCNLSNNYNQNQDNDDYEYTDDDEHAAIDDKNNYYEDDDDDDDLENDDDNEDEIIGNWYDNETIYPVIYLDDEKTKHRIEKITVKEFNRLPSDRKRVLLAGLKDEVKERFNLTDDELF